MLVRDKHWQTCSANLCFQNYLTLFPTVLNAMRPPTCTTFRNRKRLRYLRTGALQNPVHWAESPSCRTRETAVSLIAVIFESLASQPNCDLISFCFCVRHTYILIKTCYQRMTQLRWDLQPFAEYLHTREKFFIAAGFVSVCIRRIYRSRQN